MGPGLKEKCFNNISKTKIFYTGLKKQTMAIVGQSINYMHQKQISSYAKKFVLLNFSELSEHVTHVLLQKKY